MTMRTAIITGASSGIGAALAELLLARGWRVVGLARRHDRLEPLRDRWREAFEAVACDLADPASRERAAAGVSARHARIDALVNNAGEALYELPTALPAARWRSLLELNLLASVDLVHALVGAMPPGSSLVNVSSVTARHVPNARFAPYAVTKAALEAATAGLRLELDPRGVRVSVVAPGLVATPIYDGIESFRAVRARLADQVPTWLSASEVAEAIVWILERPAHVVVSELALMPRGQAR
jgi:3-hydroxy acid dehydrogenase/malonic semialdehyde reductase